MPVLTLECPECGHKFPGTGSGRDAPARGMGLLQMWQQESEK